MESILINSTGVSDISTVANSAGTPEYIYNENLQKILSLPRYGDARVHTGGSLNIIARDIYGDEKLAWIISLYNGITDDDIVPGLVLYYPNLDAVKQILKL